MLKLININIKNSVENDSCYKMFEYLMAEIPLIVSKLYEMRKIVEENRIGVVAKENTPEGLKEAIKKAI